MIVSKFVNEIGNKIKIKIQKKILIPQLIIKLKKKLNLIME